MIHDAMPDHVAMPDDLHLSLSRHLPGGAIHSIAPLGAGLDNTAWLVNDEIVVRQASVPDPDAIRREAALLGIVRRHATLPVPDLTFTAPENGILAYRALPGRPIMDLAGADTTTLATQLGEFLNAIHRIPLSEVTSLVPRDDDQLSTWLDEARSGYEQITGHLPVSSRQAIEAFLDEPAPPQPKTLTFCHNDFGAEHTLIDPATMRITGIIDWTDAAITDPVRDLALILRDLGPDALERALTAYGRPISREDHARLVFHSRCKLIEDIAYGIESGDSRYRNSALAHLDHTFPQQDSP